MILLPESPPRCHIGQPMSMYRVIFLLWDHINTAKLEECPREKRTIQSRFQCHLPLSSHRYPIGVRMPFDIRGNKNPRCSFINDVSRTEHYLFLVYFEHQSRV